MKKIGLIGGVSPESTIVYYKLLNRAVRKALGGEHSADMLIRSLDFSLMHQLYDAKDWPSFTRQVVGAAQDLKAAGCDAVAITSNTVSLATDDVVEQTGLKVIHLIDTLADALRTGGATRPLLLGTPFVMEGDFYRAYLSERHGVETLTPGQTDRREVERVIFEDLVEGVVLDRSRRAYLDIIARGVSAGADGVILGCTEIGMLIEQSHLDLPVYDTTLLHVQAIADFVVSEG